MLKTGRGTELIKNISNSQKAQRIRHQLVWNDVN